MAKPRPTVELSGFEFAALWMQTIPPGKRDDAIRDVLDAHGRDPDYIIPVSNDELLKIEVGDIKRKWGSRERGHYYTLIECTDPEEPGVHHTDEGDFIYYLVQPGAPHSARIIAALSELIGKDITVINEPIDEPNDYDDINFGDVDFDDA